MAGERTEGEGDTSLRQAHASPDAPDVGVALEGEDTPLISDGHQRNRRRRSEEYRGGTGATAGEET